MQTSQSLTVSTEYRTLTQHELELALDFARRQYARACEYSAERDRLYEEAIDDGDREALADLRKLAYMADDQRMTAYQDREAAYAALSAVVN
jgi:RNA polymerase-interacting CarD/CdnL/TRCF family regulator